MYEKYQTEALVLGNREMGEADRMIVLFSRDFGLVRARAPAIRTERYKMRYALASLSTEALDTTLFTHTAYDREHVLEAEAKRDQILSSINKAIAETHLYVYAPVMI